MSNTISQARSPLVVTPANRDNALAGLPVFFRLACNLAGRIRYGCLHFDLPDGRRLTFRGAEEAESEGVIIVRDFAFARRAVLGGDIGFYEGYAAGLWETPSIANTLYVFARNADHVTEAFLGSPIFTWLDRIRHSFNRNTRAGSRRNISAHYDLGNEFYEKWLDGTMTYSSAHFPEPNADLSVAQIHKYRTLAEKIEIKPGDAVLEIGCGWGGFAEYAAGELGARVTGLTLSREQLDYAQFCCKTPCIVGRTLIPLSYERGRRR